MKTTVRILIAVVVRVGAFAAAEWAFTRVYEATVPATHGDADLGEGLLVFLLMMGLALMWGAWDGYWRGFGPAAAIWVATGALAGAVVAVMIGAGEPGRSLSQALADLADSAPFLAGLVLVPGLVGAAVAAVVHHAASPSPLPR